MIRWPATGKVGELRLGNLKVETVRNRLNKLVRLSGLSFWNIHAIKARLRRSTGRARGEQDATAQATSYELASIAHFERLTVLMSAFHPLQS